MRVGKPLSPSPYQHMYIKLHTQTADTGEILAFLEEDFSVSFKLDHFYPHTESLPWLLATLFSLPSGMRQCVGVSKTERKWIPLPDHPLCFLLFYISILAQICVSMG